MIDFRTQPKTSRKYPRIQVEPPEASRIDVTSVNWCDKTTWYGAAIQVTDETLTDSGDQLLFDPATQRSWIDVMHGKLTGERSLRAQYQPVVEVDAVEMVEDSPEQNDNDYTIDYTTGKITFNSTQSGTVVVKSYYYQNGSVWVIKPLADKVLRISKVEVQFSENIDLTDTVIFQPHGWVQVYAPELWDQYDPPGPYPTNTLIPLPGQSVYQTMQDYINEAELAYPSIPSMGGSSWRGMNGPIRIFQWPYKDRGTTDLTASTGLEIHIHLENDLQFGGDIAVATFYGTSEPE